MSLWGFFVARRTMMRRLSTLCIVVLGIHLGADALDPQLYRVIDQVDYWVDPLFAHTLEFAQAHHLNFLAKFCQRALNWVDIAFKQSLAMRLAQIFEVLCALLVMRAIWPLTALKQSLRTGLKETRGFLNLAGVSLLIAAILLPISGIIAAVLALETQLILIFKWGPYPSRQGAAILAGVVAIFLWLRMVPFLVVGLINGVRGGELWWVSPKPAPGFWPWFKALMARWWIAAIVLPPTLMTLQSPKRALGLISRMVGDLL